MRPFNTPLSSAIIGNYLEVKEEVNKHSTEIYNVWVETAIFPPQSWTHFAISGKD